MQEELQQLIPIEEQISQELVKQNVTETIIANLKEKYLPLKIAGIDDKETYLLVKDARKECKSLRVLAKKICEKGREDAVAIQKAWVAKQKEVTDQISEVEDYLEKQEKEYEAAVAKDKEDRRRKQEEQLIMRQQALTSMGALYSDGSFTIGEVSFELSVVKESEQDIWEESILPKFKEEYEKVEAERIEQERVKQEREAEMKRQQEELERKQKELADQEAKLKRAQEEQERKQKEEDDRKIAEAKAAEKAMISVRVGQLQSIGLRPEMSSDQMYYTGYDCAVHHLDITGYSDEKWGTMIDEMKEHVSKKKEEAEQKRLSEIEEQKEAARRNELRKARLSIIKQYDYTWTHGDIADPAEEAWDALIERVKAEYDKQQRDKWEKEQDEKRKLEELKKQQEMEQAKDKEKWEEIMRKVDEIQVYEMRSSQYRKKAMILREKLEEIKAL